MSREKLTLDKLTESLFIVASPSATNPDDKKSDARVTVRMPQSLYNHYHYHSEKLSVSMSDIFRMTLQFVADLSENRIGVEFELAKDRLHMLFWRHGLGGVFSQATISRVLGRSFPLGAISNANAFASEITLDDWNTLARFFSVELDWLMGSSLTAQSIPSVYNLATSHAAYARYNESILIGKITEEQVADEGDLLVLARQGDLRVKKTKTPTDYMVVRVDRVGLQESTGRSLSLYKPIGTFYTNNNRSLNCLKALINLAKEEGRTIVGSQYPNSTYNEIERGRLIVDALGSKHPSHWDVLKTFGKELETEETEDMAALLTASMEGVED